MSARYQVKAEVRSTGVTVYRVVDTWTATVKDAMFANRASAELAIRYEYSR